MILIKAKNFLFAGGHLKIAVAAVALLFGVFGEADLEWLGNPAGYVAALLGDGEARQIAFCCLAVCWISFATLYSSPVRQNALSLQKAQLFLAAGLGVAAIHFFSDGTALAQSKLALRFLTSVAFGYGIAAAAWRRSTAKEKGLANRQWVADVAFSRRLLVCLMIFLAAASMWPGKAGNLFDYRGEVRWNGPWNNPNIFGLLMGCGALLALGLGLDAVEQVRAGRRGWLMIALSGAALTLMGRGLLHSYSRGAWLGTAVGMIFFVERRIATFRASSNASEATSPGYGARWVRNWLSLTILFGSLLALGLPTLVHTDRVALRRVASIGNSNDLSWRNRLVAWEGALQIAAENPWTGAGWKVRDGIFDQYYRPPTVDEGLAIAMNDYLMLTAMFGVPASLCFFGYFWVRLAGRTPFPALASTSLEKDPCIPASAALCLICRSGAVALAVGFWFDGGLFSALATGTVFWILLEVGATLSPANACMK